MISNDTSFVGKSTVFKISKILTKPAGTEFRPREAIVAIRLTLKIIYSIITNNYLTVITSGIDSSTLFNCAIKMTATASYKALPSILIVDPSGSTKRVIRLSTLMLSSMHCIETGRAAPLKVLFVLF